MADLIDFYSPSKTRDNLVQPLIPLPNSTEYQNGHLDKSGTLDNPFDLVLTEVTEYERTKEDPFEQILLNVSDVQNSVLTSNKLAKETEDKMKLNKTFNGITNTLYHCDNQTNTVSANQPASVHAVNSKLPIITITHVNSNDLSILNTSNMNDSLLDNSFKINTSKINNLEKNDSSIWETKSPLSCNPIFRNRRSFSTSDTLESGSQNPLNIGFNKGSMSILSMSNNNNKNGWDSLVSGVKRDAPFSDSSNFSNICADFGINNSKSRFSSNGSVYSSISTISSIPCTSSGNSSSASSNTMNRGLIGSQLRIETTSITPDSSLQKSKNGISTDLVTKFLKLRSKIFESEEGESDNQNLNKSSLNQDSELNGTEEKLIDINSSSDSVFTSNTNEISFDKVNTLAKGSHDEEFIDNIEIELESLSEEEVVENLIKLSPSPVHRNPNKEEVALKELNNNNKTGIDVKELESSLLLTKDTIEKKVTASVLLKRVEDLLRDENNPTVTKLVEDLKEMLDVQSNITILQTCLDNNYDVSSTTEIKQVTQKNKSQEKSIENKENFESNNCSLDKSAENTSPNITNNTSGASEKVTSTNSIDEHALYSDEIDSTGENTNILKIIHDVVNKKDANLALDIIKILGEAIKGAVKNKNVQFKEKGERRKSIRKSIVNESDPTDKFLKPPVSNRLYKSASTKSLNGSLEMQSSRRSLQNNSRRSQTCEDLNPASSISKGPLKSNLKYINKHFSSESAIDKTEKETRTEIAKPKIGCELNDVKSKLKKKVPESSVNKKGPLKAVIPVGNMQKKGLIVKKRSPAKVTPPKNTKTKPPNSKLTSSTPNLDDHSNVKKSPKNMPAAASTPDTNKSKSRRSQANVSHKSIKTSLNYSMEASSSSVHENSDSKNVTKLTPIKSTVDYKSRISRYSPMNPTKMRHHSQNDLGQPDNKSSFLGSPRPKNVKPITSPLKTSNKILQPRRLSRSMSMLQTPKTKFGRRSTTASGAEKENCAA